VGKEITLPRPLPSREGSRTNSRNGYDLLGQSQPSSQFSQQAQSHLQSGQSLQQSAEQQAPLVGAGLLDSAAVVATPAVMRPLAIASVPNNFVNM
jgi:hypothetical protein